MDPVENVKVKLEKMDVKDLQQHEDEELHSFIYSIKGKQGKQETLSCARLQTIMDLLMTCPKFNENAKKNEGKECVIVRDKPSKAITPHFPCCLIDKEEHLIITYLKAKKNYQQPNHVSVRPGTTQNDLVVFHVEKDGRILVNTALTAKQAKLLSVYAYKRETIEDALKRDGRFKSNFFNLKDIKEHDRTINISNKVVADFKDKTFTAILDAKKAPQESDGSVPSSSTNTSTTSTRSPQQPAPHVPVNTDMPEHTAKQKPRPIANSKEILALLRKQFKDLVDHMQKREGKSKSVKELFRVEYGKNVERMACMDVKMMRQLTDRADSVCQVRVEGMWKGSGFLLFDKFILTNAHVIENIIDVDSKQLRQDVTVSFCFEDLVRQDSVPVKRQVVVFEKLTDESGCYHDWALLELDSPLGQTCPSGLLENIVTSPQSGGICIIGHPGGGVKKADPCFIIPVGDCEKDVIDRYKEVQPLITRLHFDEDHLTRLVNQSPVLAYDSCFSYGSSGSPVFDEFCNVVAMHTGGYVYETEKGHPQKVHPQSFIEYAQPLSRILPRIIIQIVERQKFDVLEAYLHYTSIHQKDTFDQVKKDVKKIVETQKPFAFEKELNNYAVDSENIKEFIKFFCPQDHSEPMDTD